jgi:hypothetical protein
MVDLKSSVELVFYVCCDMYRLLNKTLFIYLYLFIYGKRKHNSDALFRLNPQTCAMSIKTMPFCMVPVAVFMTRSVVKAFLSSMTF